MSSVNSKFYINFIALMATFNMYEIRGNSQALGLGISQTKISRTVENKFYCLLVITGKNRDEELRKPKPT